MSENEHFILIGYLIYIDLTTKEKTQDYKDVRIWKG